jgi:trans-aconitate methyltransferase
MADVWQQGGAYERYMGRWSRRLAPLFLAWLDQPAGLRWADLGCGTGALTAAIAEHTAPSSVLAIEPSAGFLEQARSTITDARVTFEQGSVEQLDGADLDVVVAGLVLNFLPDPDAAVGAARRAAPAGVVSAYVWDYAEGMELLLRFWEAASRVAGRAVGQDEVSRFEIAHPDRLSAVWRTAGLQHVDVTGLEIEMVFEDFADFWSPFLEGTGPAPSYVAGLDLAEREELREALRAALPADPDGRIRLPARAWAVRGASV